MCLEGGEFGRQEHEDRLYLGISNWVSFAGARDAPKGDEIRKRNLKHLS